jgi:aryl-alcohol dehydrogenase-like predicted oxidoreductase
MGVLSGKFTPQTRFDDSVRAGWNEGAAHAKFLERLAVVEKLRILESPTRSLAQAALQFVISHEAVTVAIPGAKSPQQARSNAAAGRATLSSDELARARAATA